MIYYKAQYGSKTLRIELDNEGFFTECTNCGKEIEIDTEFLIDILKFGDLASTSVSCCTDDKPRLKRIK